MHRSIPILVAIAILATGLTGCHCYSGRTRAKLALAVDHRQPDPCEPRGFLGYHMTSWMPAESFGPVQFATCPPCGQGSVEYSTCDQLPPCHQCGEATGSCSCWEGFESVDDLPFPQLEQEAYVEPEAITPVEVVPQEEAEEFTEEEAEEFTEDEAEPGYQDDAGHREGHPSSSRIVDLVPPLRL